jgi:hypothetical protein
MDAGLQDGLGRIGMLAEAYADAGRQRGFLFLKAVAKRCLESTDLIID